MALGLTNPDKGLLYILINVLLMYLVFQFPFLSCLKLRFFQKEAIYDY